MTTTVELASLLSLPHHYYVAPQGNDAAVGDSPVTAFATLQHALRSGPAGRYDSFAAR